VTEDEIDGIGGENIAGAYACMNTFQSLDNANNKAFSRPSRTMWGEKTVIGDVVCPISACAMEVNGGEAGSFDVDKIAAASPGIEFKARRKVMCASMKTITSVEDPRRQGQNSMASRADLRDRRSGRARSVPKGYQ